MSLHNFDSGVKKSKVRAVKGSSNPGTECWPWDHQAIHGFLLGSQSPAACSEQGNGKVENHYIGHMILRGQ